MMRKNRRTNWSISPHREKLARAVDEWFATSAATTTRGSLGEFAETHDIPRTTLFKYVREDTSKRQLVRGGDDGGDGGLYCGDGVCDGRSETEPSPGESRPGRGKRRLLTRSEIHYIVAELQRRATAAVATTVANTCDDDDDDDDDGEFSSSTINNIRRGKRKRREHGGGLLFSRKEAMQLLMEQFHLSRKAASRQLTRYVLPEIMIITANMTHDDDDRLMERRGGGGGNGLLVRNDQGLLDDNERGCQEQVDDSMEEKKGAKGIPLHHQQQQHQQQNHDCRHSPLKNGNDFTSTCSITTTQQTIVIIDVISPIGQALLKHYYNTGRHTVAGCGCDGAVICKLKALYPMAILTAVDITNDTAIRDWTATNLVVKDTNGGGMELLVIDVVIFVAAASGVRCATNLPIWELSQKEFDTSFDYSVRGAANVIRHLVPRLIIRKDRGGGGGTFVAVVSTGLDVAHAANTITSAYAIEGLIKSVANSIPDPLCAAILSPGLLPYVDMNEEEEQLRQHQTTEGDLGGGDRGRDVGQWANVAGPMILKMSRRNNGMSMSVPGF